MEFLTKRGYAVEEILQTGLLVSKDNAKHYDRFRDRVIFPICDYSGKVLGYSARVAPGGDESQAKYVNSPETEVYHKSKALYGIDKAKGEIKQKDFVLLVEGNMDVIATSQAGIKNVVAVSGTALTQMQLDILKRYTKNIKMLFDMDLAGETATKKSIKLCLEKNISVQIVELPFGKDAADVAKNNPELLRKAVLQAKSAMEYLFQKSFSKHDKNNPEGKKKISEEILEMIDSLASEVERSMRNLDTLVTSSAIVTETSEEFKTMSNYIGNSKTLLNKYGRRELTDKVLIGLAMAFFFACVMYVVLRRLYWK